MDNLFNIKEEILETSKIVEEELKTIFEELDKTCLESSAKVL